MGPGEWGLMNRVWWVRPSGWSVMDENLENGSGGWKPCSIKLQVAKVETLSWTEGKWSLEPHP